MKLLTFIMLLSVVFGMPIVAKAQQQIVFEDDFTDNRNEWYQVDQDECTITVENGKYAFHHKRQEGAWLTWQKIEIDQHQDFRIEVTINKVSGANNYGYGLLWGLEDVDNYNQFVISGNGYYRHGILSNDQWSEIIEWSPSEYINQENTTNILSIQKLGNQVKFYINDHYVNEAEFGEFFGNKVGFIVYRNMKIEIDHILVEQLSPTELPLPTPTELPPLTSTELSPPTPTELPPLTSVSEKRIALVIGNSDYGDPPLPNPVNDTEDMANVLRALGFHVIKKTNVNRQEMEEAISEFARLIQNGEVALFYFSGYGSQVRGENYLLPVGENIRSEGHILHKAVKVGDILSQMKESGNPTNIIILDACREVKGVWLFSKGLAAMNVPEGTVLAYATTPGMLTLGRTERNSMYTKHLLEAMQIQGIPIGQAFENVLKGVEEKTDGQQTPWTSSSLQQEFYFNPQ